MISSFSIKNIFFLILIVAIQMLVFNQMVFLGKYSPFIYVILLYIHSFNRNQYEFLILSFLLGLFIDFLSSTGGIHTSASVLTAFLCSPILKKIICFDLSQNSINEFSWFRKIFLLSSIIFIHHVWIFFIEFLQWKSTMLILTHIVYNSLITIFFSLFLIIFFNLKKY